MHRLALLFVLCLCSVSSTAQSKIQAGFSLALGAAKYSDNYVGHSYWLMTKGFRMRLGYVSDKWKVGGGIGLYHIKNEVLNWDVVNDPAYFEFFYVSPHLFAGRKFHLDSNICLYAGGVLGGAFDFISETYNKLMPGVDVGVIIPVSNALDLELSEELRYIYVVDDQPVFGHDGNSLMFTTHLGIRFKK